MIPQPLYVARDQTPAFALRYSWSGWATNGNLHELTDDSWRALSTAWEADGLRLLERKVNGDGILLNFSTTPAVSPVLLATRAKGRLQHACRTTLGTPVEFSRKLAVRSVGENRTATVESYIRSQVEKEHFVDPRFADFLKQFTVTNPAVNLSLPSESESGCYWSDEQSKSGPGGRGWSNGKPR